MSLYDRCLRIAGNIAIFIIGWVIGWHLGSWFVKAWIQ